MKKFSKKEKEILKKAYFITTSDKKGGRFIEGTGYKTKSAAKNVININKKAGRIKPGDNPRISRGSTIGISNLKRKFL